jgi:nucleoside-diphosphate-sugar epimerase
MAGEWYHMVYTITTSPSSLRLVNTYGPRRLVKMPSGFHRLVHTPGIEGKEIQVCGDGQQVRASITSAMSSTPYVPEPMIK